MPWLLRNTTPVVAQNVGGAVEYASLSYIEM